MKNFDQLCSMPKLFTEENNCLYYTKYTRSHIMADCHNIQALIHDLFLRSFRYSFTNPIVDFVCRSAAVWIYQLGLLVPAQLSLQPQLVSHSELSVSIINTVSLSRRCTSHITQNLVTMLPQPGHESLIHKKRVCKAQLKVIREITV